MTKYDEDFERRTWSQHEACVVAELVEKVVVPVGAHVALTGGCLYKQGLRDDLDLLFYRIRQTKELNEDAVLGVLTAIGFEIKDHYGWVYKAKYAGKSVDLFFPENYPYVKNGNNSSYGQKETKTQETWTPCSGEGAAAQKQ